MSVAMWPEPAAPLSALRTPPHDLAAEQHLLGALLANNRALDRVQEFLRPEHFADAAHGRIYAAIVRRVEAGQVADVITLRPEFEADADLVQSGGAGRYLTQLLTSMVGIINAGEYGRLIRECWHRRELIAAGEALVNGAFDMSGGEVARGLQEEHEAALLTLADAEGGGQGRAGVDVARDVVNHMFAAIARRGAVSGVASGYAGLDRMTGGFQPGEMIVLAGRTSMGKTAMVGGIAGRAAAAGARVYFWGGEMADSAVMARLVAAEARLPLYAVLRGAVAEGGTLRPLSDGDAEVREAIAAAGRIGGLPIRWDDQAGLTVAALRSRLRRHKRRHGLDLVVVDYLGLLRGSPDAMRQGKTAETGDISKSLKAMAQELRVPVIVCSQLNRGLEGRDIKRPTLADLRQSGEIEEDANTILFIHREHYYLQKARPEKKPGQDEERYQAALHEWRQRLDACEFSGELMVAKQRQGELGSVALRWAPRMTWYFDANEAEDGPAVPGLERGA